MMNFLSNVLIRSRMGSNTRLAKTTLCVPTSAGKMADDQVLNVGREALNQIIAAAGGRLLDMGPPLEMENIPCGQTGGWTGGNDSGKGKDSGTQDDKGKGYGKGKRSENEGDWGKGYGKGKNSENENEWAMGYGNGENPENEDEWGKGHGKGGPIDTPPDLPYMVFQLEQEKRDLKIHVQMLEQQVVRLKNVAHLLINSDVVHRR